MKVSAMSDTSGSFQELSALDDSRWVLVFLLSRPSVDLILE